MCGVCGSIGTTFNEEFMQVALAAHECRGPDYQARLATEVAGWQCELGHNRLSIIDLSSAGHQPMRSRTDDVVISYNGEIYNYVELRDSLRALGHAFHTTSDTEVLLAAYTQWGIACVERFNGMFAFGLLDAARRQLYLVRDRFGVKPLYYSLAPDRLYFSSTARPVARHTSLAPCLPFIIRGLETRVYDHDSEETQYVRVRAVRPAHVYRFDLGASNIQLARTRYYDFSGRTAALRPSLASLSVDAAAAAVKGALDHAVQIRLRADVPIGVSLSGGLDSSSVASLASARHSEIVGFCYGTPDDSSTEGPIVESLRRQLGLRVQYVKPSPTEMADAFWNCLRSQDAPFSSMSVVAQYEVYRHARAAGIRVLLGGQGGDEAFMGYRKYQAFHLRRLVHRRRYRQAVAQAVGIGRIMWSELGSLGDQLAGVRRYMGAKASIHSMFEGGAIEPLALGHSPSTDLWHRQVLDLYVTSLPTLLRYEDRNSMANSIESRLPFVDYEVVEMGVALPERLKLHGALGKWVVRQAMSGRLPDEILRAVYKRGFDAAPGRILAGGLGSQLRQRVGDAMPALRPYFKRPVDVEREFSDERLAKQPVFAHAVTAAWLATTVS